jgi:hypothetical protein
LATARNPSPRTYQVRKLREDTMVDIVTQTMNDNQVSRCRVSVQAPSKRATRVLCGTRRGISSPPRDAP